MHYWILFNIKYYPEKEQFVFSCLNEEGGIHFEIYDTNFAYPYPYGYPLEKFTEYQRCIYGYSILYYTSKDCYYVLFDFKYNDIEYIFKTLKDINEDIPEPEDTEQNKTEEVTSQDIVNGNETENDSFSDLDTETDNENNNGNEEDNNSNENNNPDEIKESEIIINECKDLDKCRLCNEGSISNNLCLSCNTKKGYFPINYDILPIQSNKNYIECINLEAKPQNFYFDSITKEFNPCYESCATCDYSGNSRENNCTSCEINYTFKPDFKDSTNCVTECLFSYYYSNFGQYRCTASSQCPDGYNFFIQDKGKCIDKCENDNIYKYQYNGECLNKCPVDTKNSLGDYLCKDIDLFNCLLSNMNYISLGDNITDSEVELMAKNYALEFKYTENHVSVFTNNIYTIALYKNCNCISILTSDIPEVDFDKCEEKIKNNYQIKDEIVMVIITKMIDGKNYQKLNSFSMFNPNTGEKLPYDEICKDDILNIKESLIAKLNITEEGMIPIFFLVEQNIDIFNLSSEFYTDICYDFISPIKGKDIPLKDRISLFYPNITLCENGCNLIGINLTAFKSICECKFKDFINKNVFLGNPLYQNRFLKINALFGQTNIEVLKCYKYFLSLKNVISSPGPFIILGLFIIQIIMTIFFHIKNLYSIRKYIFYITNKFISFLFLEKNNNKFNGEFIINMNNDLNNKELQKKNEKEGKISKKISKKNNSFNMTKKKTSRNNKNNIIKTKDSTPENSNIIIHNKTKDGISYSLSKSRNLNLNNNLKLSSDDILFSSNENIASINKKYSPFILGNISSDINININVKDEYNIDIQEYLSTEIDNLDYYDTIRKDQRHFCQYFYYKLTNNQMVLSIFYAKDPLNPRSIKILLLILDIDLYLFINGLFFSEDYISELLHISIKENIFNFIDRFIDRLFFITIVGVIISYIIEYFFIDERVIKGILKREKNNLVILKYEISRITKKIIIRYKLFILVTFIIISITLYYIICFNNVYPSVKDEWIKTSVILIAFMQLLSVFQYLLETCIRFISFKCKSEKLYKLSLLLS